jgi:RNA polymerase sigma factor (sigma-70 family)
MTSRETGAELSDSDLVVAALAGAHAAFDALVRRHRPAVEAVCWRVLGTHDAAADATQEATLLAFLHLQRLKNPDSFGPWLIGIALNTCRRFIRKSITQQRWPTPIDSSGVSQADDPADVAQAHYMARLVRKAVSALPSGQRDAVLLFYFAGLTQAEVATELGTAVGAVKTRLYKARAQLRTRLNDMEESTMPEKKSSAPRSADALMAVMDVARYPASEPGGVPRHVVRLEEVDGDRNLKIWIGESEATGIALRLEGADLPRPDTYLFAQRLLEASNATVKEVRIHRLADEVFYASTVISAGPRLTTVDARPSDALNLALLSGCRILVSADVLAASVKGEAVEGAQLPEADASQLVASVRERFRHQPRAPTP